MFYRIHFKMQLTKYKNWFILCWLCKNSKNKYWHQINTSQTTPQIRVCCDVLLVSYILILHSMLIMQEQQNWSVVWLETDKTHCYLKAGTLTRATTRTQIKKRINIIVLRNIWITRVSLHLVVLQKCLHVEDNNYTLLSQLVYIIL